MIYPKDVSEINGGAQHRVNEEDLVPAREAFRITLFQPVSQYYSATQNIKKKTFMVHNYFFLLFHRGHYFISYESK